VDCSHRVVGIYLHFTSIWKRLKVTVLGPLLWSQYTNTILNLDMVLIYCDLLTTQWKQSLRSAYVQVGHNWSLTCNTAQLDGQNRIFALILIITEAKSCSFLYVQTKWDFPTGTQRFCKNGSESSRIESFCKKFDSSRVESPFFSTWLESSLSHQKICLESSRVIDSSHSIIA